MRQTQGTRTTTDLGNNEIASVGYRDIGEQGFLACTLVESKTLKTERGAIAWLVRRGFGPDGRRSA